MGFLIFIGGIIILVLVLNLRGRVQKLEQFIKSGAAQRTLEQSYQQQPQKLEAQQTVIPNSLSDYIKNNLKQGMSQEEIKNSLLANGWKVSDVEKAFNTIIAQAQTTTPIVTPVQVGPTLSDRFVGWLKEDWLLKLGSLLLLIGFGWLTTYAFLNNWIGPMGRIALGIIAGALFILLGFWRIKNYITQGGIFLVLGSTTILLTIFAARTVYDFFTPLSALMVMFLSTAFVALASVKYNSRPLSLLSLTLAGIAPLLTKSPATDHIWLFAYLFVVILGAIWIVALTGQRELTAASLIIVSVYSAPHLLSPSLFPLVDIQTLLLFAYAFAALFFLTNTAGILKLKDKEIVPDLVTAAGNGLFLLAWITMAAKDEWKSLIIAAWMVTFAVGAFLIFRITQRREPFYVYTGVGIAMLAAATSAELHGATLTIAYTIEGGIVALIAYLVLRDIKIAERISLLLIWPAILSVGSLTSRAWATSVMHKDFFVLLVLALTLLGLGAFFLKRVKEIEEKEPKQLNATLLIVGSFYVYALLWLSLHAGLQNDNTAVMISLVIYTIIGLIAYFYGLANEKRGLRLYGGALVGFVVGRLLLVEVWRMELTGRIITFFLIGALLASTAFLGKRKQNKIINIE
jgi:uncharacterized membrane protein